MSDQPHPLPLRLARAWITLYTHGLPTDRRDARRAELASDLWEQAHDAAPGSATPRPVAILGRVLAGMPADIAWRVEERAWARAGSASHAPWYRYPVIILVIAVIIGMVAIVGLPSPASLEQWGDTRDLAVLVLSWSVLAVVIGALLLLIVAVARAGRQ